MKDSIKEIHWRWWLFRNSYLPLYRHYRYYWGWMPWNAHKKAMVDLRGNLDHYYHNYFQIFEWGEQKK